MNTKMNIKMILMILLMVAISTVYAEEMEIFGRKFEDLPENMKQKIRHIQKEFDNEGSIGVSTKKRMMISIISDNIPRDQKENQNKKMHRNNHREEFIAAVQAIKVDEKDSNSTKKAVEIFERNGMKLFEKA